MGVTLSKIKIGERVSSTYYLEVIGKSGQTITVKDCDGTVFDINGKELIEDTLTSANQYTKTVKCSRTEMVEQFLNAKDAIFQVEYIKADKSRRTLIGHLTDTEDFMGRSTVIDLEEASTGSGIRQVDHRTMESLILNGVKYELK